jgi:hypothetical protein
MFWGDPSQQNLRSRSTVSVVPRPRALPFFIVSRDIHVSIAALGIMDSAVELHTDLFENGNRRIIFRRDKSK